MKRIKHKKIVYFLCILDALLLVVLGCVAFMTLDNRISGYSFSDDINDANVVRPSINLNDKSKVTPLPTPIIDIKLKSGSTNATQIALEWDGSTDECYIISYKKPQDELWHREVINNTTNYIISGLQPGTTYEYRVQYMSASSSTGYLLEASATTTASDFGDPFANVHAELKVGNEADDVVMTNKYGSYGASCWVQFDTKIYYDQLLTSEMGDINGGTPLVVEADENGYYAYLKTNGRWSLRVKDNRDSIGWMDADTLMIDIAHLFDSAASKYGIQINRTNAYSSIFTAGGAVDGVDVDSDPQTRYACLKTGGEVFAKTGYNAVEGITNQSLPHYGSKDQMPVVWDLALELLTCQKYALKNGTTLYIYEGYRPRSTSEAVSRAMSKNGYLDKGEDSRNLATGYLPGSYGTGDYIAYNSRHNKGTAVDLTLVGYLDISTLGKELAMQTKMHTLDFRCNMAYNNANAELLYNIMMNPESNLEPLRTKAEWWHFQLTNDLAKHPQFNNYVYADYVI